MCRKQMMVLPKLKKRMMFELALTEAAHHQESDPRKELSPVVFFEVRPGINECQCMVSDDDFSPSNNWHLWNTSNLSRCERREKITSNWPLVHPSKLTRNWFCDTVTTDIPSEIHWHGSLFISLQKGGGFSGFILTNKQKNNLFRKARRPGYEHCSSVLMDIALHEGGAKTRRRCKSPVSAWRHSIQAPFNPPWFRVCVYDCLVESLALMIRTWVIELVKCTTSANPLTRSVSSREFGADDAYMSHRVGEINCLLQNIVSFIWLFCNRNLYFQVLRVWRWWYVHESSRWWHWDNTVLIFREQSSWC